MGIVVVVVMVVMVVVVDVIVVIVIVVVVIGQLLVKAAMTLKVVTIGKLSRTGNC